MTTARRTGLDDQLYTGTHRLLKVVVRPTLGCDTVKDTVEDVEVDCPLGLPGPLPAGLTLLKMEANRP